MYKPSNLKIDSSVLTKTYVGNALDDKGNRAGQYELLITKKHMYEIDEDILTCDVQGGKYIERNDNLQYFIPQVENKNVNYCRLHVDCFGKNPTFVIAGAYTLDMSTEPNNYNFVGYDGLGKAELILPKGMNTYCFRCKSNYGAQTRFYCVCTPETAKQINQQKHAEAYGDVNAGRIENSNNGSYFLDFKVDRTRVYNPETGEIEPANASTLGE